MAVSDSDFGRRLQDLYEAENLTQLRNRLGGHLADHGIWGVVECINSTQVTETYADLGRYTWDNFAERVGRRRREMLQAITEAGLARGIEEENRRLRWRAAQKRPYLTTIGGAAEFQVHQDYLGVYGKFGLRAAGALVVPLPDDGLGQRSIWTMADTMRAWQSAPEVTGLLTVYNHMRQILSADVTETRNSPWGVGDVGSAQPSERAEAVRAYIEDRLDDTALGVDQLCQVFAMSRRTAYRMFAKDGGVVRYLTERRLVRALNELSGASPSRGLINSVAIRYGFDDQNRFSRLFRRRFHMPPSDAVLLGLSNREPARSNRGSVKGHARHLHKAGGASGSG